MINKLLFIFVFLSILLLLFKMSNENSTNVEHEIGKDTVYVWNDGTFQIGHYSKSNYLEFHYKGVLVAPVLKKVITYKVDNNKFFVVTGEGCAVIDDTNIAKVLVTVPEDEFTNGYSINDDGEKIPYSRRIDDSRIIYLESFEEFSESEQKRLNKMIK